MIKKIQNMVIMAVAVSIIPVYADDASSNAQANAQGWKKKVYVAAGVAGALLVTAVAMFAYNKKHTVGGQPLGSGAKATEQAGDAARMRTLETNVQEAHKEIASLREALQKLTTEQASAQQLTGLRTLVQENQAAHIKEQANLGETVAYLRTQVQQCEQAIGQRATLISVNQIRTDVDARVTHDEYDPAIAKINKQITQATTTSEHDLRNIGVQVTALESQMSIAKNVHDELEGLKNKMRAMEGTSAELDKRLTAEVRARANMSTQFTKEMQEYIRTIQASQSAKPSVRFNVQELEVTEVTSQEKEKSELAAKTETE